MYVHLTVGVKNRLKFTEYSHFTLLFMIALDFNSFNTFNIYFQLSLTSFINNNSNNDNKNKIRQLTSYHKLNLMWDNLSS